MGKGLNPADAARKAERKREVKKNKAARQAVRSEKLFSNPAALKEELEKWRSLRPGAKDGDGSRLDGAAIANRVKKLEAAYTELLQRKRVRCVPARLLSCLLLSASREARTWLETTYVRCWRTAARALNHGR